MDSNTEIRKIPVALTYNLIQYLESSSLWKDLMSKIPKHLDSADSLPKYSNEHISLIEDAGMKQKRPCSEILFEEWGTSGRRRPTVNDLLEVFKKFDMYRAADIVSMDLLKGDPVERPATGPAARIDLSVTNILLEDHINQPKIESMLDKMSYPSAISDNSSRLFDKNINKINLNTEKTEHRYPINFTSMSFTDSENVNDMSISDLMKFSKTENVIPEAVNESVIPMISSLLVGDDSDSNPSFSVLLKSDDLDTSEERSETEEIENIPNLSIIIQSTNETVDDGMIPMLSALQMESESQQIPIISLSTNLPHVKYEDIKSATRDFSELSDVQRFGGKIGSGGFGDVYLALNLHGETTAAVKRLALQNESKKYNDLILKQFKAEVEVLSNYIHENVVSLLGYSCDGPAYCLVYEYVDGGSLRERLEGGALSYLERMRISLGTSIGIEYLHKGNATTLIHRDIKSANILLTKSNMPKLCDFGLAKFIQNQTNTTTIIGTSAYMAPEAFRGDVSTKMDIFSFGIVLLELLTGLPPMDENRKGVDLLTHIMEVCEDNTISPLIDKNADLWPNSENLFKLALDCVREKRNRPDIAEVRRRIENLLQ